MNIIIVEQLNKANRQSIDILASTQEQSVKRRDQLKNYYYTVKSSGWYADIINAIKTYWHC
jgi:hypothetical protein